MIGRGFAYLNLCGSQQFLAFVWQGMEWRVLGGRPHAASVSLASEAWLLTAPGSEWDWHGELPCTCGGSCVTHYTSNYQELLFALLVRAWMPVHGSGYALPWAVSCITPLYSGDTLVEIYLDAAYETLPRCANKYPSSGRGGDQPSGVINLRREVEWHLLLSCF